MHAVVAKRAECWWADDIMDGDRSPRHVVAEHPDQAVARIADEDAPRVGVVGEARVTTRTGWIRQSCGQRRTKIGDSDVWARAGKQQYELVVHRLLGES